MLNGAHAPDCCNTLSEQAGFRAMSRPPGPICQGERPGGKRPGPGV